MYSAVLLSVRRHRPNLGYASPDLRPLRSRCDCRDLLCYEPAMLPTASWSTTGSPAGCLQLSLPAWSSCNVYPAAMLCSSSLSGNLDEPTALATAPGTAARISGGVPCCSHCQHPACTMPTGLLRLHEPAVLVLTLGDPQQFCVLRDRCPACPDDLVIDR